MYALKVFWWVKQACLRWAPPSSFPRDSLSCDIYLVWLSNWLQNEQAWHSSSSKASNYSTRVPTTSSCLAAIPLELTKKASRLLSSSCGWSVVPRPPYSLTCLVIIDLLSKQTTRDSYSSSLTHCFQSSSSTDTLKAKQVLKMAGFWPIFWQQFCLNYVPI